MSSQLDNRIRRMMQHVVDESPPPPDTQGLRPIGVAARRRIPNWVAAVAAAAVVLILIGGAALLVDIGDDGPADVAAPATIATNPPATALIAVGQTVSVTVSGVSGHHGDEFAGVLYKGSELTDLDDDALGGFWWVVSSNDNATTTEIVRQPAAPGDGRFPYVSDQALTIEPGTYTLVLWVDDGLGPARRWVPVNTDGRGLYGCHIVIDVTDAAQTDVAVTANLEPDGWNINCTTGQPIPGTNSAEAVAPTDLNWWPYP